MFQTDINYSKLKTNLRLVVNRLKLLERKKSELAQKSRKEIADYIAAGKYERAKIRVEHIIREDYMVEGLEMVEMYCDLLLSRFGLIQQSKMVDASLSEAISSIIWASPRIETDAPELKAITDQFAYKYGKKYVEACKNESIGTISEKLKHKIGVQPPPRILIEKYLIEIANNYNVNYEPDLQIMREYEQSKGIDALLLDGVPNTVECKDNIGFVGFPQYPPFNYPPQHSVPPPSAPPMSSIKSSVDINDCPLPNCNVNDSVYPPPPYQHSNMQQFMKEPNKGDQSVKNVKETNDDIKKQVNVMKKSNIVAKPTNNNDNNNGSNKVFQLPSVPSETPQETTTQNNDEINNNPHPFDDIDFDDLTRRFEELKKRK